VVDAISRSFTVATPDTSLVGMSQTPGYFPEMLLFAVWLCGFTIGVIWWVRWWRQIRAAQRLATPLDVRLPIPVMSSRARLEPGIFGIRKPVLLLPEGITERLTPDQLEAVLAHELCHVRRRDNLTAAIHMVVETIFWFHPLVWWIRARLVEERERACDDRAGGGHALELAARLAQDHGRPRARTAAVRSASTDSGARAPSIVRTGVPSAR